MLMILVISTGIVILLNNWINLECCYFCFKFHW